MTDPARFHSLLWNMLKFLDMDSNIVYGGNNKSQCKRTVQVESALLRPQHKHSIIYRACHRSSEEQQNRLAQVTRTARSLRGHVPNALGTTDGICDLVLCKASTTCICSACIRKYQTDLLSVYKAEDFRHKQTHPPTHHRPAPIASHPIASIPSHSLLFGTDCGGL